MLLVSFMVGSILLNLYVILFGHNFVYTYPQNYDQKKKKNYVGIFKKIKSSM